MTTNVTMDHTEVVPVSQTNEETANSNTASNRIVQISKKCLDSICSLPWHSAGVILICSGIILAPALATLGPSLLNTNNEETTTQLQPYSYSQLYPTPMNLSDFCISSSSKLPNDDTSKTYEKDFMELGIDTKNLDVKDEYGMTALHRAARIKPHLIPLLLDLGANLTNRDSTYWTVLHHLVIQNDNIEERKNALEALIKKDPNINIDARSIYGSTPLCTAAIHSPAMVRPLLELNANPNVGTFFTFMETPLKLLIHANNDMTPPAIEDRIEALKALVEYGVNLKEELWYYPHRSFYTPFLLAAKFSPELIPGLLECGANPDQDELNTALYFVCMRENYLTTKESKILAIETLIQNGADINAKIYKGKTPLQLCSEREPDLAPILSSDFDAKKVENKKKIFPWFF